MIPFYDILPPEAVERINEAALQVIECVGVRVFHDETLARLADAGANVDRGSGVVRLSHGLVNGALAQCGKQFVLYGRDGTKTARFGYGDIVTLSSPGQYSWVDWRTVGRRAPTLQDTFQAIQVGDALENITIVGAMTQPVDVPEPIRDVCLTAELVKRTRKPTRVWIKNGASARYILEIYRIVAGGAEALRRRPPLDHFLEPISPLQLPRTGLEILLEFTEAGLPVSFGPMVQASATGPATLAGTLVQENAEILAALTITQILRPGTPVMYGGIPHIMDPRSTLISFGSPEQGLMAAAMAQIARHYGLPVYVNAGLGDSKVIDVQTGYDRGMTMLMGALAGGDLLGHMGIAGADQAASLLQLVVDNEMIGYIRRILAGIDSSAEKLAAEVIASVGPGGNYLGLEHTARHFRKEFWIPGKLWDRSSWAAWEQGGATSMAERAAARLEEILACHEVELLDEAQAREIDGVVAAARQELCGE